MPDEKIVGVHTLDKDIVDKLTGAEQENVKQLLSGIETMTVALVHNEVEQKTDDT